MVSFCACVSSLCAYLGGMSLAGFVAKTRSIIALFSGRPGTIGVTPDLVVFSASARMSRRRPAMRVLESNPWQRKHVSDMMGRISRLNLTSAVAPDVVAKRTKIVCLYFIGSYLMLAFETAR